ncbi:hypothetical protein Ahy_A06g026610 [Arachis hypogaea]|uniref:Protein FAR1-RELATED SEQUENCE n=1 Tax=Arachis hypogaea TaxID=3818 RepID=A0A445CL19_ARAHY|nr:hypothetical protein Ahy_A06g026610 [Arachis hypogaea]
MVYEVVEQVSNSTFNKFVVTYDTIPSQVKCQCLLFESRGILCRHSPSALSFERVDKWSKNIKRRHTHIKNSHDKPLLEPRSRRFDDLVFQSQNICEFASKSEDLTTILHCAYDNIIVEMQEYKAKSKRKCSLSHEDASLEDINELQSPPCVRTRGRPKNRLRSNTQKQIANTAKKKEKKVLTEWESSLCMSIVLLIYDLLFAVDHFYGGSVVQSNFSHYHGHIMNYNFRYSRE